MYLRAVELTDAEVARARENGADARAVTARASRLGANALVVPHVAGLPGPHPAGGSLAASGALGALGEAALLDGLRLLPPGAGPAASLRWPAGDPAGAAQGLTRRHRLWPNSLRFVASPPLVGDEAAPIHPAVATVVRRSAGRPGTGFSAPWPTNDHDPTWAPVCVLPESPLRRVAPGTGFAVNLWLCASGAADQSTTASVVARVGWAGNVHSWRFEGPLRGTPAGTIATLPLVRPLDEPLTLTLDLQLDGSAPSSSACSADASAADAPSRTAPPASTRPLRWVHRLDHDTAGRSYWSLLAAEE
ncbi:MAG: hypothetical protein R2754_18140 [Microthrixaceae bacterium]